MKRVYVKIVLLVSIVIIFLPTNTLGYEKIILSLYINHIAYGDTFFLRDESGNLFISVEQFLSYDFEISNELPIVNIEEKGYYPLTQMEPEVAYSLNNNRAEIFLEITPELFRKQNIDFSSRKQKTDFIRSEGPSAILNYRIFTRFSDDWSSQSHNLPLSLSGSLGPFYGLTSFLYTNDFQNQENWVRQGTTLFYDQPHELQRWALGDFTATNDLLGGSGVFGGISLSRTFNMDPYFDIYPKPQFAGILENASYVDVIVNDSRIQTQSLRPGEFVLENIPNTTGFGEVRIVTRDAFGNEIETSESFYVGRGLLKPGLSDFSYNLGFLREEINDEMFEYKDFSVLGFHRLGLTRWITGGVKLEASQDLWNVGLTTDTLVGYLGELGFVAAASGENSKFGSAYALTYQFASRKFNISAFGKYLDFNYTNLSKTEENDRLQSEINFQFGAVLGPIGSLSLGYDYKNYYQSADRHSQRLFFSKRISNDFSINFSFRNIKEERFEGSPSSDEQEYLFGITWLFDQDSSARYEYQSLDSEQRQSLSAQKNPPIGNGYGYDIKMSRDESLSKKESLNSRLTYRATYGVLEGLYSRYENSNTYGLSAAGALSWVDSDFYISKPVNDSMTVVHVSNLNDVAINLNEQEVGVTNENGVLVVPDLYSYRFNNISIQDDLLPINYTFETVTQNISPYPFSGSSYHFELEKLQAFEGTIFISENGVRKPAEYAQLILITPYEKKKYIIGKRGIFYFENLTPGQHDAKVIHQGKTCEVSFSIPKSEELIIDLGEIDCVFP